MMSQEELQQMINSMQVELEYYSPSQSMEYYDPKNNQWYNRSGQQLRNPKEYDTHSEGYTPFGDE